MQTIDELALGRLVVSIWHTKFGVRGSGLMNTKLERKEKEVARAYSKVLCENWGDGLAETSTNRPEMRAGIGRFLLLTDVFRGRSDTSGVGALWTYRVAEWTIAGENTWLIKQSTTRACVGLG
jgi:hypothetical protein